MRFRYVVEILRAAKPDADFSIGSLPRRFRRFVSEVLFQSKVIAQRPIAGVAHALQPGVRRSAGVFDGARAGGGGCRAVRT